MREAKKVRAALFIDGRYFTIINNYYLHVSVTKKKFDITSLINNFQKLISSSMNKKQEEVVFLHRHLYIGVLDYEQSHFDSEERVEYLNSGITSHTSRIIRRRDDGKFSEKGVDTSLTLDAFELVSLNEIDVLVLVTGDADFVPLVSKTKKYMKDVFLFYWDIDMGKDYSQNISTSNNLIKEVNGPAESAIASRAINMGHVIEKRRLSVFKEETPGVTDMEETPTLLDQIVRREQGRVFAKRDYSIFISPGTGGDALEYVARSLGEVAHFCVGQAVEYNTRNGSVFDLRQTDP